MNRIIRRLAPAFLFLISVGLVLGDDFKSLTISGGGSSDTIRVHNNQFMVVRNFTQDTGSTRGMVMVSAPPSATAVNVLSAAILDAFFLEPINNVIIAGPADVTVTCPDVSSTCFVSYKKDNN